MVLASPKPIRNSDGILSSTTIELPVVDLNNNKGEDRSVLSKLIVKACEDFGFFKVINHGVNQETIARIEEAALGFFGKPMSHKKMAAPVYGCKNIGFNGDMGEVEYLLLNNNSSSIAHHISNDPSNFR
ncbi:hypothetical protein PIB30_027217, partial [Stylosanthes scabra]|nr:hypothetical protein [Stylosanthes scabra]